MPLACMEMNEYIPPSVHEFAARGGPSSPFLASRPPASPLLLVSSLTYILPELEEFMSLGFQRRLGVLDRGKIELLFPM